MVHETLSDGGTKRQNASLTNASLQVDDVLAELGPIQHPNKPMPHELIAATDFDAKGKHPKGFTHAICCKETLAVAKAKHL